MEFHVSATMVIMNLAYVLNLIGLAVKNILILRILLISAQMTLIYTSGVFHNWPVMFWNSIFLAINLFRTIMLLLEKRSVIIPDELKDIREENFCYMTDREFLKFWQTGTENEFSGGKITETGYHSESVFMVMAGMAEVRNHKRTIAVLNRGGFIGEMSYITGKKPSADVIAEEPITLWEWKQTDLDMLKAKDYTLWVKMQQALGHDLVTKVNRMSQVRKTSPGSLLKKANAYILEESRHL